MSKYNYYDRTLYGSVLSRILNVNTTQRSPFAQDKLTLMAKDLKVLISLKEQEG